MRIAKPPNKRSRAGTEKMLAVKLLLNPAKNRLAGAKRAHKLRIMRRGKTIIARPADRHPEDIHAENKPQANKNIMQGAVQCPVPIDLNNFNRNTLVIAP